jgi:hypothetical protein
MQCATFKTIALLYPIPDATSTIRIKIFSREIHRFNHNSSVVSTLEI